VRTIEQTASADRVNLISTRGRSGQMDEPVHLVIESSNGSAASSTLFDELVGAKTHVAIRSVT